MNVITVSQLNTYLKSYIESNPIFGNLFIKGEISNFKHHSSGHCYMTLKDETSVIKAVMFRSAAMTLRFDPENGMNVIVNARLSIYERDGQYQLYINEMQPDGVGDLHVKFEQLKEKLASEGLFDEINKKPIPKIPTSIGIVTSSTSAAIKDILNILKRRFPINEIFIYNAIVQGDMGKQSIIDGIEYFNRVLNVDVIIIGRGGGSIEDLWCFNEEEVARAIFHSKIPIISAVGHETDFTIADFVSDLRAPTPSAAAELATPSINELLSFLSASKERLKNGLYHYVDKNRLRLENISNSPYFKNPFSLIEDKNLLLADETTYLVDAYSAIINNKKHEFSNHIAKLDSLSPLKVLKRGYLFVTNEQDAIVESIDNIHEEDILNLKFHDGSAKCKILSKESELNG